MTYQDKEVLIIDEKIVLALPGRGVKCWRLECSDADPNPQWRPYFVEPDGTPHLLEWLPLPGGQTHFLQCPAFEALATGPRGGGKSLTLLMDFASEVGKGYGPSWNGIFVVRAYKGFENLIGQLEELISSFFPDAKFFRALGNHRAEWPTGEVLHFRALDTFQDYLRIFKGRSVAWLGFDELTQWEDESLYLAASTIVRSSNPDIPKRIRAATNPGRSNHWIQRRFRIPEMDGQPFGEPGIERCAIPIDLYENFVLLHNDPYYPEQLKEAATSREQLASDLLGVWTVGSEGLFTDVWDSDVHITPPIDIAEIPHGYYLDRAYDHGSASPFSIVWFAEANGEPLKLLDGSYLETKRGDLFVFGEWYGANDSNGKKGLRLTISEIADGIIARENSFGISRSRINPGPADNSIFNQDTDRSLDSLAEEFARRGVEWTPCTKGSRSAGYDMIRSRLADSYPNEDGIRERPGLFVASNCQWFLRLVPNAPRSEKKPDDVAETYPDHISDVLRYRLASGGSEKLWRRGF